MFIVIHAINSFWFDAIQMFLLHLGYQNSLTVLYSQGRTPNTVTKATRHIPSAPERILDAPEIIDDYCKHMYIDLRTYR